MKKSYVGAMAVIAAAGIYFAAQPRDVLAQTSHANDTYMVVSRTDGRRVVMHLDGEGNHCWATTSVDRSSGIAMGDDLCNAWDEDEDEGGSFLAKISPSKISFRENGKKYAISDAATVKKARSLFEPLVAIDEQQEELGAKQRALGDKQRQLGRQQREVKVRVPDMSADIQKVEADAKRLNAQGGTQSELGDLQSELGDLQSRLGDLQSQAGEAQSKLGDQQSELGDQQSAMGDQQSELGDKSEAIAKDVGAKVKEMLEQAVKDGTAKSQ